MLSPYSVRDYVECLRIFSDNINMLFVVRVIDLPFSLNMRNIFFDRFQSGIKRLSGLKNNSTTWVDGWFVGGENYFASQSLSA